MWNDNDIEESLKSLNIWQFNLKNCFSQIILNDSISIFSVVTSLPNFSLMFVIRILIHRTDLFPILTLKKFTY